MERTIVPKLMMSINPVCGSVFFAAHGHMIDALTLIVLGIFGAYGHRLIAYRPRFNQNRGQINETACHIMKCNSRNKNGTTIIKIHLSYRADLYIILSNNFPEYSCTLAKLLILAHIKL